MTIQDTIVKSTPNEGKHQMRKQIRKVVLTCVCTLVVSLLAYGQAGLGKAAKWAVQHGDDFVPVVKKMVGGGEKVASQFGDDVARYGGYGAYRMAKEDDDNSFGTIVLVVAGVVVVGVIVKKVSS